MRAARRVLLISSALIVSSCQQRTASAALQIPHPDDASKSVEYFVETPTGSGPWPTIVLLHGHQEGSRPGGKDFVDWGVLEQMSSRGYLAVAVSQPGYGKSTGPADFSGAFTQHAVAGVIAKLRAEGQASPSRLLIQGISRGALTAGLIAAHDSSVSGLVLISGVYDLTSYVADSTASAARTMVVRSLIAEAGAGTDALIARSVLPLASRIKASTLILNGAQDDRTDPAQAAALAGQMTRSGGDAKAIIYPDFGHQIPVDVRNKDIDPFIDRVLGKASAS